jgi:hypothetical protein
MARRTKREMEYMKDDCRYYLLQTNNDPQKAHELMVKEHLQSGKMIPYYIKGVKDFIQVSQELAVDLNRKQQMKKADQQRFENKQTIINYIINLTVEEMKAIYKQYKDNVSQSDKLVLHEVYSLKFQNEYTEKYIDQHAINVFTNIYRELKQPA